MRWGKPCVALLANGKRCNRPHCVEVPVLFEWDPVAGRGQRGPDVTLCRMHDYVGYTNERDPSDRNEIVGGWFGRARNEQANCWTIHMAVYESREGSAASKQWWALRVETVAGDCSERLTYDEAARFVEHGGVTNQG